MSWYEILCQYYFSVFLTFLLLVLLWQDTHLERRIKRWFYELVGLFLLLFCLDHLSIHLDLHPGTEEYAKLISSLKYAIKPALLYFVLIILVRDTTRRKKLFLLIPLLIEIVVLAVSFPFDWVVYYLPPTNMYRTGPLHWITWSVLLVYIAAIILAAGNHRCSPKERFFLFFGESFVLLCIANELLFRSVKGMEQTVSILSIFVYYQYFSSHFNTEYRQRKEEELNRTRIQAMISQIRPHFIYNSLACIAEVCHEGSPEGENAILTFSSYLRNCFRSLNDDGLIPFSEELNTIERYIELEQLQDPDKFTAVYDIREKSFQIPILSLETLVENAVKHGIRKKRGSGTVLLRTLRDERGIVITIQDDGVGFTYDPKALDGTHLGLKNAKMRLQTQCGASMQVVSRPGQGTEITIIIPEEKHQ